MRVFPKPGRKPVGRGGRGWRRRREVEGGERLQMSDRRYNQAMCWDKPDWALPNISRPLFAMTTTASRGTMVRLNRDSKVQWSIITLISRSVIHRICLLPPRLSQNLHVTRPTRKHVTLLPSNAWDAQPHLPHFFTHGADLFYRTLCVCSSKTIY